MPDEAKPIRSPREIELEKLGHAITFLNNHLIRIGWRQADEKGDDWRPRDDSDAIVNLTPPRVRDPLLDAMTEAAKYIGRTFRGGENQDA